MKSICIGSDHAGYELKEYLFQALTQSGYDVKDFGTYSKESVDYPDYVHPLCLAIETSVFEHGILLCGSANGVCMTANKHVGIRAALCWQKDIAELARKHNNANVVCIPARFVAKEYALEIVNAFLMTGFEGGRHQQRVEKIAYPSAG